MMLGVWEGKTKRFCRKGRKARDEEMAALRRFEF